MASVDAHARTLTKKIQTAIAEAEREKAEAPDETARRTWGHTLHELREGLDRLRFGPFAATPPAPEEGR